MCHRHVLFYLNSRGATRNLLRSGGLHSLKNKMVYVFRMRDTENVTSSRFVLLKLKTNDPKSSQVRRPTSLLNVAKFMGPILNAWPKMQTNGWP